MDGLIVESWFGSVGAGYECGETLNCVEENGSGSGSGFWWGWVNSSGEVEDDGYSRGEHYLYWNHDGWPDERHGDFCHGCHGDPIGWGDGSACGNGFEHNYDHISRQFCHACGGYGNGGFGRIASAAAGSGEIDGSGYGARFACGDGCEKNEDWCEGCSNKYVLQKYKGQKVYYIDGIPCCPRHVRNNFAFVDIIEEKDFSTTPMFIAKGHGLFAHGMTIKEAAIALEEKRVAILGFEERKQEFFEKFLESFNDHDKYPAKEFSLWHGRLTGSCEAGREHFAKEHNINLDEDMITLAEFFEIVKGAYGWGIIKKIPFVI